MEVETLKDWQEEMGKELVVLAIDEALKNNVRNIKYINGILTNWKDNGLKTLAYPSQNNEDECEKKFKEEEVKTEESGKSHDCEEIETVSFLDYKTSDDSVIDTIGDELLEENNEVINDIPEPNYKGDISTIPIECQSIFVQA